MSAADRERAVRAPRADDVVLVVDDHVEVEVDDHAVLELIAAAAVVLEVDDPVLELAETGDN